MHTHLDFTQTVWSLERFEVPERERERDGGMAILPI